ncbi:MAG: recombinase family protein [Lachnospiraceae bacterium]|jgi:DNA invertase Pin-like site-specific DNA recombinase|nr:recombinase family protein [Lachnospiraceae bacterium]
MAGTTKKGRQSVTAQKRPSEKTSNGIYSVGIYARLSVDNHNEKNESIETQIEIAKTYLDLQADMVLFDCYTDLGKTGTNFEREGFNRLMTDVRMHKVNCIIVKDFSRFGRNYIETGNYIQKIFPFLGVRFISLTDQYDSLASDGDELGVNLKNLTNEMYARDISVKVKSSKEAQWERGSYTGGIPPYGYRAEWINGKKCLFVEEGTSDIVKEIFQLYDEGKNQREIVIWLYEKKVHRPSAYRRYGHIFCEDGEEFQQWSRDSVKLILTNPLYIGCLVQAMTCGKKYNIRKKSDIDSEDWSAKENTHEAIIPEEQFFSVAERLEQQASCYKKGGSRKNVTCTEDIFEGLLFCGECGTPMGRTGYIREFSSKHKIRLYAYFCRKSLRVDQFHCEKKYITGHTLEQIVKAALKQEFALIGMTAKELIEWNRKEAEKEKRRLEKELAGVLKEAEGGKRRGSGLYLKYRSGEISKDVFLKWKEEEEQQVRKRKDRQEEINRALRNFDVITESRNRFLRALLRFNEKSELDKELMQALIEKISIFPDKRIEIAYRFHGKDFLRALMGGGRLG